MQGDLGVWGGAPSAIRTRDLLLRRQSLYPLSYRGRERPASLTKPRAYRERVSSWAVPGPRHRTTRA